MGIGSRPAVCASCGKRLTRKSWYYRNGSYFCKTRCWEAFRDKAADEAKSKAEEAKAKSAAAEAASTAAAQTPTPAADDKPAA